MGQEFAKLNPAINEVGRQVFDAAFAVHRELGHGLLESAYIACMKQELALRGLSYRVEVPVPVIYKDVKLEAGYRIDLLVEECVIVELKAIDCLAPIHEAQLLTYMKLKGIRLGYLINFNSVLIKDGIRRMIL